VRELFGLFTVSSKMICHNILRWYNYIVFMKTLPLMGKAKGKGMEDKF
jgi:hypothetical protein